MKYNLYIVILSTISVHEAFSQKDTNQIVRNLLYIEAGGVGGYGSINYERAIFNKKNIIFAMRLGMSIYNIKDYTNKLNPNVLIPLCINGYYGNNNKIELGIGQTFANIVNADFSDFKPKRISKFHTNFSIGYQYQKKKGGIIFRCAYTPIIEFNKYFRHWAGISLGYAF